MNIPDPMATMGGPPGQPGAGAAGAGAVSSMTSNKKEMVFDPIAMHVNFQRVERIRSVMGIASGCVAGTLGMTGLQGLGES
jgi:hypothetical protein